MPDEDDDLFLRLPVEATMRGGSWHMLLNSPALHPSQQAQLKQSDASQFGPNRANQSAGDA